MGAGGSEARAPSWHKRERLSSSGTAPCPGITQRVTAARLGEPGKQRLAGRLIDKHNDHRVTIRSNDTNYGLRATEQLLELTVAASLGIPEPHGSPQGRAASARDSATASFARRPLLTSAAGRRSPAPSGGA